MNLYRDASVRLIRFLFIGFVFTSCVRSATAALEIITDHGTLSDMNSSEDEQLKFHQIWIRELKRLKV